MLDSAPDKVAIGIDHGQARCGVAASDPSLTLASPLCAVPTEPRATLAARILAALGARQPTALVVGLPLDPRGGEGEAAQLARELGELIGKELGLEPQFVDERFTTSETTQRRREAGQKGKQIAGEIDAYAAAAILQSWLDRSE